MTENAERRLQVARWAVAVLVIGATLVFSVGMLILSLQIRDTQKGIIDCTRPGGACYERSLRRSELVELNSRNIARLCRVHAVDCEPYPEETP